MQDSINSISNILSVILNHKRCPDCLQSYSAKTVHCEIKNIGKMKNTVFSPQEFCPIYLKTSSYNSVKMCKSTYKLYEPHLFMRINCQCGHSLDLPIPSTGKR